MKLHCLALAGAMLAMAATAHAGPDLTKADQMYRVKCQPCHSMERGVNKVGPSLMGIIDQPPASLKNFDFYSPAMKAFAGSGRIWDDATLATFLTQPADVVPGTNMRSAGINNPDDVADMIAYLHLFSRQ